MDVTCEKTLSETYVTTPSQLVYSHQILLWPLVFIYI